MYHERIIQIHTHCHFYIFHSYKYSGILLFQIADRMMAPPPRDFGGRSVHSGSSKFKQNKALHNGQMTKPQLHQSNLQSWPNQNGVVSKI